MFCCCVAAMAVRAPASCQDCQQLLRPVGRLQSLLWYLLSSTDIQCLQPYTATLLPIPTIYPSLTPTLHHAPGQLPTVCLIEWDIILTPFICRPIVHCSGCPKSIAQRSRLYNNSYLPHTSQMCHTTGAVPCATCHTCQCPVAGHSACQCPLPAGHKACQCPVAGHVGTWPDSVYSDSSVYITDTDNM